MVNIDGTTLYTLDEIADKFKLNYQVIQSMVGQGRLKACKVGNRYYVSSQNLQSYIQGNAGKESRKQEKNHKRVVTIRDHCTICKKNIDPKEDSYSMYEGTKKIPLCCQDCKNKWRRMSPAEQKKLLSSTKAPASSTAPSNAYRTKVEHFNERDRKDI